MKSPRSPGVKRNIRLDRHSGTGSRGLPKKNGAGGKTVWGSALDQAPVACLDKKDPNYDSENETGFPPDLELTPPTVANDDAPVASHESAEPSTNGTSSAPSEKTSSPPSSD